MKNIFSTLFTVFLLISTAFMVTVPPTTQAQGGDDWYDTDWNYRKTITINHTQVPSTLSNFPVALNISFSGIDNNKTQNNGNDILFVNETNVIQFNHEIEYFDETSYGIFWVNVTSLSGSSNTTINMYYGNDGASNQENPSQVFDFNDPDLSSGKHTIDGSYDGALFVYAEDIDSDGDVDVLGTAYNADDITWWENDGSESFTKHTIDGSYDGARSVYACDIDGDGDIDILGAAFYADDITWWENDGSESFTKHTIDGSFDGAISVYAIDVDDDGDIDVLGAAYYADDITWWENDGSESFTKHTIDSSYDGAHFIYTCDVDGDSDIDVLGVAAVADDITWWENDGSESFTKHTIDSSFDAARAVRAADVDGDEDIDILGAASNADDVTWWENDGSESFTEHTIDGSYDGAFDAYPIDIDSDDDIDILGGAYVANDMTWWENDGSESFTKHTIDSSYDNARYVYACDIDGDCDIDVLGHAYDADDITWWESSASPGSTNASWLTTYENNQDNCYDGGFYSVGSEQTQAPPKIQVITPINGSSVTNFSNGVLCKINTTDENGDLLNITWAVNRGNAWDNKHTNVSVAGNGTYSYRFTDFKYPGRLYLWRVYADNGTTNYTESFYFETECDEANQYEFDAESVYNINPVITSYSPSNNSYGQMINPEISVTTESPNFPYLNATWFSNYSGTWQVIGTNNSYQGSSTIRQHLPIYNLSQKVWWRINISWYNNTDWMNNTYCFTIANYSSSTDAPITEILSPVNGNLTQSLLANLTIHSYDKNGDNITYAFVSKEYNIQYGDFYLTDDNNTQTNFVNIPKGYCQLIVVSTDSSGLGNYTYTNFTVDNTWDDDFKNLDLINSTVDVNWDNDSNLTYNTSSVNDTVLTTKIYKPNDDGWEYFNADVSNPSNVTFDIVESYAPIITNETIYSTPGNYIIHIPYGITKVDVLVIAAGGGCINRDNSGGGGGGGIIFKEDYVVTQDSNYSIVVGAGVSQGDGENSSFGSLEAWGGGAAHYTNAIDARGNNGGSGGGGSENCDGENNGYGGVGEYDHDADPDTYGHDGGDASKNQYNDRGGGGGGAGSVGQDAYRDGAGCYHPGVGGDGLEIWDTVYSAGGRGGWYTSHARSGDGFSSHNGYYGGNGGVIVRWYTGPFIDYYIQDISPTNGDLSSIASNNITILATYSGNCSIDSWNASFKDITQLSPPSMFSADNITGNPYAINITWSPGTDSDYTYIEYNNSDDSTWNVGDHTQLCNLTTGNTYYLHDGLSWNTTLYYKAWGYNSTINEYSTSGITDNTTTWLNHLPITSGLCTNGDVEPNFATKPVTFNWTYYDEDLFPQEEFEIWVGSANGTFNYLKYNESSANISMLYNGTTLPRGVTSYVRVRCKDNFNFSSWEYTHFKLNKLPIANSLKTDGDSTPMHIIGCTPTLSWVFDDDGDGDSQAKYRVQVGDDNDWSDEPELWNFTDTTSDEFVVYNGNSLSQGSTYYWRVQLYDSNNEWGAYTETYFRINTPPYMLNFIPANNDNSVDIGISHVYVDIRDNESDTFDWTIETSNGDFSSGSNDVDGTFPCSVTQLDYNTSYTWWVNATDSYESSNITLHFTIEKINSSVDTIVPYNFTGSTTLKINVTAPSNYDNITLWYRNSTDNITWSDWINWINITYNPDTSSPWNYIFDFPNGSSMYYQFYSIARDMNQVEDVPSVADAKLYFKNLPPLVELIFPSNNSLYSKIYPLLTVNITDPDNDRIDSTWLSNSSGSWQPFYILNNFIGGIKTYNNSNFSSWNTTYWWNVSTNDSSSYPLDHTFKFKTRRKERPDSPTNVTTLNITDGSIEFNWTVGWHADKTYVEQNYISNWNRGDGEFVCNTTNSYTNSTGLPHMTKVYFKLWSWNETANLYSIYPNNGTTDYNETTTNTPPEIYYTNINEGDIVNFTGPHFYDGTILFKIGISDTNGDLMTLHVSSNGKSSTTWYHNNLATIYLNGFEFNTTYDLNITLSDSWSTTYKNLSYKTREANFPNNLSQSLEFKNYTCINFTYSGNSYTTGVRIERNTIEDWTMGDGIFLYYEYQCPDWYYNLTDATENRTYYFKMWGRNYYDGVWGESIIFNYTTPAHGKLFVYPSSVDALYSYGNTWDVYLNLTSLGDTTINHINISKLSFPGNICNLSSYSFTNGLVNPIYITEQSIGTVDNTSGTINNIVLTANKDFNTTGSFLHLEFMEITSGNGDVSIDSVELKINSDSVDCITEKSSISQNFVSVYDETPSDLSTGNLANTTLSIVVDNPFASDFTGYFNSNHAGYWDEIESYTIIPGNYTYYSIPLVAYSDYYNFTAGDLSSNIYTSNNCDGRYLGKINSVKVYLVNTNGGLVNGSIKTMGIRPIYDGLDYGDWHLTQDTVLPDSASYTICSDSGSPDYWTWEDIKNLDIETKNNNTVYLHIGVDGSDYDFNRNVSWSLNITDGTNWDNFTYSFQTYKEAPTLELSPIHNPISYILYRDIIATTSDDTGDEINLTWYAKNGSSWDYIGYKLGYNGSYALETTNYTTEYSTKYTYKVIASDGNNETTKYSVFTTRERQKDPKDFSALISKDGVNITLLKADNHTDTIRVQRKGSGYPISPSDGTTICNTSNSYYLDTSYNNYTIYYYTGWAYNSTDNTYSLLGSTDYTVTSPDNPTSLSVEVLDPTSLRIVFNKSFYPFESILVRNIGSLSMIKDGSVVFDDYTSSPHVDSGLMSSVDYNYSLWNTYTYNSITDIRSLGDIDSYDNISGSDWSLVTTYVNYTIPDIIGIEIDSIDAYYGIDAGEVGGVDLYQLIDGSYEFVNQLSYCDMGYHTINLLNDILYPGENLSLKIVIKPSHDQLPYNFSYAYNDSNPILSIHGNYNYYSNNYVNDNGITGHGNATMGCEAATNITNTSCTINSHLISSGGEDTTCGFLWTNSTGNHSVTFNDTNSSTHFSHNISGYEKAHTYNYTIFANNSYGNVSNICNWTTLPQEPLSPVAVSVSDTTIDLRWIIGNGSDITRVVYKDKTYPILPTSGDYINCDTNTTTLIGLSSNEDYYISFWSYNNTNELYSIIYPHIIVTTNIGNVSISNTQVYDVDYDDIALSSHLDSTGNGICDLGFRYGLDSTNLSNNITAETSITNPMTYTTTILDLDFGTTYYYQAWAKNQHSFANSTTKEMITAPVTPEFNLSEWSARSINVTWSNVNGADEFYLLRGDTDYPDTPDDYDGDTYHLLYYGNLLEYNDQSSYPAVYPGTIYYYRIWAYNTTNHEFSYSSWDYIITTSIEPEITAISPSNGAVNIDRYPEVNFTATDGYDMHLELYHFNQSGAHIFPDHAYGPGSETRHCWWDWNGTSYVKHCHWICYWSPGSKWCWDDRVLQESGRATNSQQKKIRRTGRHLENGTYVDNPPSWTYATSHYFRVWVDDPIETESFEIIRSSDQQYKIKIKYHRFDTNSWYTQEFYFNDDRTIFHLNHSGLIDDAYIWFTERIKRPGGYSGSWWYTSSYTNINYIRFIEFNDPFATKDIGHDGYLNGTIIYHPAEELNTTIYWKAKIVDSHHNLLYRSMNFVTENITMSNFHPVLADGRQSNNYSHNISFDVNSSHGDSFDVRMYAYDDVTDTWLIKLQSLGVHNGSFYFDWEDTDEINKEYTWRVNVTDNSFNQKLSQINSFRIRDYYIPDPPDIELEQYGYDINITLTPKENTSKIELRWSDSGYPNKGSGHFLFNDTTTSYVLEDRDPSKNYYFSAWAWNNSESVQSDRATAMIDLSGPVAPTCNHRYINETIINVSNIRFNDTYADRVYIRWDDSTYPDINTGTLLIDTTTQNDSIELSDLDENSKYYFSMWSKDDDFDELSSRGTFVQRTNGYCTITSVTPDNTVINLLIPNIKVKTSDFNINEQLHIYLYTNATGSITELDNGTRIEGTSYWTNESWPFTLLNTTYWYTVNVTDGYYWDNGTYNFTTGICNPPTISHTPCNSTQINLAWTQPPYSDKVKITRNDTAIPVNMNDGTVIYFGNATFFNDTNLIPGKTYYYMTVSYNSTNDDFSITNKTFIDKTYPLPPTNIVASFKNWNSINLTWTNDSSVTSTIVVKNINSYSTSRSGGIDTSESYYNATELKPGDYLITKRPDSGFTNLSGVNFTNSYDTDITTNWLLGDNLVSNFTYNFTYPIDLLGWDVTLTNFYSNQINQNASITKVEGYNGSWHELWSGKYTTSINSSGAEDYYYWNYKNQSVLDNRTVMAWNITKIRFSAETEYGNPYIYDVQFELLGELYCFSLWGKAYDASNGITRYSQQSTNKFFNTQIIDYENTGNHLCEMTWDYPINNSRDVQITSDFELNLTDTDGDEVELLLSYFEDSVWHDFDSRHINENVIHIIHPGVRYYEDENRIWYNSSWDYAKEITIINSQSGHSLTINVSNSTGGDVSCDDHATRDFSGIRFTDGAGKLLFYERTEYVNDSYAIFKIDPTYHESSLFMYYGNDNVPDLSYTLMDYSGSEASYVGNSTIFNPYYIIRASTTQDISLQDSYYNDLRNSLTNTTDIINYTLVSLSSLNPREFITTTQPVVPEDPDDDESTRINESISPFSKWVFSTINSTKGRRLNWTIEGRYFPENYGHNYYTYFKHGTQCAISTSEWDINGTKSAMITKKMLPNGILGILITVNDGTVSTNYFYTITVRDHRPHRATNISTNALGYTSIEVSWDNPVNTTYYDSTVLYRDDIEIYNGTGEYYVDNGLDDDTTYDYEIYTYNSTDSVYSKYSITDSDTTLTDSMPYVIDGTKNDQPISITNVSCRIIDDDDDTMSWSIYTSTGSSSSGIDSNNTVVYCDLILPITHLSEITWYINVDDGYKSDTFDFTIDLLDWIGIPMIIDIDPNDNYKYILHKQVVTIDIEDPDGDHIDVNWYYPGWHKTNLSVLDGSYSQELDFATVDNQWYEIDINLTDTDGNYTNSSYSFKVANYTWGSPSSIWEILKPHDKPYLTDSNPENNTQVPITITDTSVTITHYNSKNIEYTLEGYDEQNNKVVDVDNSSGYEAPGVKPFVINISTITDGETITLYINASDADTGPLNWMNETISWSMFTTMAEFTYPNNLVTNYPVQFTNTGSGGITFYWTFGDNSNSTDENPSHNYTLPGYYNVTLIVNDEYEVSYFINVGYMHHMDTTTEPDNYDYLPWIGNTRRLWQANLDLGIDWSYHPHIWNGEQWLVGSWSYVHCFDVIRVSKNYTRNIRLPANTAYNFSQPRNITLDDTYTYIPWVSTNITNLQTISEINIDQTDPEWIGIWYDYAWIAWLPDSYFPQSFNKDVKYMDIIYVVQEDTNSTLLIPGD